MAPSNKKNRNNNKSNNNNNNNSSTGTTTAVEQPTVKTESGTTEQQRRLSTSNGSLFGTMSEEELVAMGIDINEIRAQWEIERRLEEEAQQRQYAEQLQAEFDREYSAMTEQATFNHAESSSNASTSTSTTTTISSISESARIASVPSRSTGNQVVAAAPTIASSSSSNVITIDDNSPTSSPATSTSANRGRKRHTVESSAKPVKRRTTRIWLLPGESLEYVSDDDEPIIVRESSRRKNLSNRTPANNVSNNISNPNQSSTSNRHINNNNSNLHLQTNTGHVPASSSYDILNRTALALNFTPRARQSSGSSKAKRGKEKMPDVEDIDDWLDNTVDDVSAVNVPNNALDDLSITLMEHQYLGFEWMYKQERSEIKGGLLCDDMGLGKTIQSLAIMVSRRCPNPDPLVSAGSRQVSRDPMSRATLVICPVNLMAQWVKEIETKTKNLSVYLYHGQRRSPYVLKEYDVVITSYSTLGADYNRSVNCMRSSNGSLSEGLYSTTYHRLILDEAHFIKNSNTNQTLACKSIKAVYKWCLTATPIQNRVEDLFSLVNFVGIKPYDDLHTFRTEIGTPLGSNDSEEKLAARKIIKRFVLRRSKKILTGDQTLGKLPQRIVNVVYVDFTPEERQIYNTVNAKVLSEMDFNSESSFLLNRQSTMMSLLLRLRQACLHPTLSGLYQSSNRRSLTEAPETRQMQNAKYLNKTVVDRLLSIKDELALTECPICMEIADQPRIISTCGHILCAICLNNYMSSDSCYYNGKKSCPECRGVLRFEHAVSLDTFLKVHASTDAPAAPSLPNISNTTSSSKIKAMLRILEKTRQDSGGTDKTIIFSNFASMLAELGKVLTSMNIKHRRYDGEVVVAKRGPILAEFESNPDITVLLISTKCGSVGLNLTMANNVIMMDVGCNPLMESQAIGRVHRIGQTKDVKVDRLVVRDSVEERLMTLSARKQDLADSALDGGSKNTSDTFTKIGRNEWLYLFRDVPLPDNAVAGPSNSS